MFELAQGSVVDTIAQAAYGFAPAQKVMRFTALQCPHCYSEIAHCVKENELERDFVCSLCFQPFKVSVGAARLA